MNNRNEIKILCGKHGIFMQQIKKHLNGNGCPKCDLDKKLFKKSFLNKCFEIHGDRYDYSLVNYKKAKSKIKIICKKHGIFEQEANSHINGCNCPKCVGGIKVTKDEFIEKAKLIHGEKYDYSLVNYINSKTKIDIICPKHDVFKQIPSSHLSGSGCIMCNKNFGIMENKWLDLYEIPKEFRQYRIGKLYTDGIDLDKKIIYEFYGDFWHGNLNKYNKDDINKVNYKLFGELNEITLKREEYLKSLGYTIVSIWESDFKKLNKNLNKNDR